MISATLRRLLAVPMPPPATAGPGERRQDRSGATRQLEAARVRRYGSVEAFSLAMAALPERICGWAPCPRVLTRRIGEAWAEFLGRDYCSRQCSGAHRAHRQRRKVATLAGVP